MGILNSLFGTSKPNYSKLISNIVSAGGKGLIETKYDKISSYFQTHGETIQSTADTLDVKYKTAENNYLVFLERERSAGKDTGRTIVSAQAEIPINWNDPKIGDALKSLFKPFITSRNDAEDIIHAIYMHGQSQFIYDSQDGGKMKQGAHSSAPVPSALAAFIARFPENHGFKVNHEAIMLTEQITRDAGETELQVKVIYSIADALVREHQL